MSSEQWPRIVRAGALIQGPDFIVADEAVPMLDVSVRTGILNVTRDMRNAMGLAAACISHDGVLARHVRARTLGMYRGRNVNRCVSGTLLSRPDAPAHLTACHLYRS